MTFDAEKFAKLAAKEIVVLTPEVTREWKIPNFQRPKSMNEKKRRLIDQIRSDATLPGIITLGFMDGVVWQVDGQQRIDCFEKSGLAEALCEVRVKRFETVAKMAEEFKLLNGNLVPMRPDDILRAEEETNESLRSLRSACPFVGYDMIRRGDRAPVISASATLRNWFRSSTEVPSGSSPTARDLAAAFSMQEAADLIRFLGIAFSAWGRDGEHAPLWASLNMTLCMWLYRRLVLRQNASGKSTKLTDAQFRSCISGLTNPGFLEYLRGKALGQATRAPGYRRIKDIFVARIHKDQGSRALLPAPPWSLGAVG